MKHYLSITAAAVALLTVGCIKIYIPAPASDHAAQQSSGVPVSTGSRTAFTASVTPPATFPPPPQTPVRVRTVPSVPTVPSSPGTSLQVIPTRSLRQPVGIAQPTVPLSESVELIKAQMEIGDHYWNSDDEKAIHWYRKAAEAGDAIAQHRMGVAYVFGRGVSRDPELAVTWFRKAAAQGQGESEFSMGMRYSRGEGVEQNDAEAEKWFRKAAAQGVGMGQLKLGELLEKRNPNDLVEVYKWYTLATEEVDPTLRTLDLLRVSEKLSAEQIQEAKRQAKDFVPKRIGPADLD